MEDTYQDDYYYEPEPKRGLSGWLIALIVILALIVVCCICAVVVMAVLLLVGPAVGSTFSTIIEEIMTVTPVP